MPSIEGTQVRKLVIACDAGMGSSVLMANQLKKRLKDAGVTIEHSPVDAIPADADLVLTHSKLVDRTRAHAGDRPVVAFTQFVGDPAVDGVVAAIHGGTTSMADDLGALLDPTRIRLDGRAADRTEAVRQAGELMVAAGAVDPSYVDSMLEREDSISTYMGEGVAIPHGTNAGKAAVRADALTVVRYPEGVDWGNGTAYVVIGIAAVGEGHLPVLAALAGVLVDPDRAAQLRGSTTVEQVVALLTAVDDD